MFTDAITTPARLEVLIDVLRNLRRDKRVVDADMLYNLLQPDGLPHVNPQRGQAKAVLRAAKELSLVEDDGGRLVLVGADKMGKRATRELLLEAFDRIVLSGISVEPYFALFYAYMLSVGSSDVGRKGDEWARDFNRDVFQDQAMPNPFNAEKVTGMHRWMRWAGLGWYDSSESFNCNPYGRVRRALSGIFGKAKRLDDEAFIVSLGQACPELDGGALFAKAANNNNQSQHLLSIGLAQALLDLHDEGIIRLDASQDAEGWGLEQSDPTGLSGPRLVAIELTARK
ncbi:MAG: hypothetical protein SGJ20_04370 [Planctomycetota bacterium]|nr:hypothetical protein [Planctomycetota bacterium]